MECRKRRVKRLLFIIAGAVIALLLLLYVFINVQIRPAVMQMAKTRVQAEASKAIYACVLELLSENEQVHFVEVQKTQDQVFYVELNSAAINLFAARCADTVQEKLMQLGKQGISLPAGTAVGIPLFAGSGPMLRINFSPEGAVKTHISSEFRSAGINQTLHRIELTLTADIDIVLPGIAEIQTVTLSMPVAEELIAGRVPDVYTNVENQEEMLPLLPKSNP